MTVPANLRKFIQGFSNKANHQYQYQTRYGHQQPEPVECSLNVLAATHTCENIETFLDKSINQTMTNEV